MTYVDKLNLFMPRLNDVRFSTSSREIVSLHPYLGKPWNISLHRDFLPEKGLECTSLNNSI
jgi:hypothetical protein